jgi:hypothetical protein
MGGTTEWDNNNNQNYRQPLVTDDFAAITGYYYPVILGQATWSATSLRILIGVQNLDYHKVVGVVYTTDSWNTVRTAYASYGWTQVSGLEVWVIEFGAIAGAEFQFAAFYRAKGNEYWDNNFGNNYSVTHTSPIVTKALPRKETATAFRTQEVTESTNAESWERSSVHTEELNSIPKFVREVTSANTSN